MEVTLDRLSGDDEDAPEKESYGAASARRERALERHGRRMAAKAALQGAEQARPEDDAEEAEREAATLRITLLAQQALDDVRSNIQELEMLEMMALRSPATEDQSVQSVSASSTQPIRPARRRAH